MDWFSLVEWSQWSGRASFITPHKLAASAVFQHVVHKALGANGLTAQNSPIGFNWRERFAPLLRQIADYPSSEMESSAANTAGSGTEMVERKKKVVTVRWGSPLTAKTYSDFLCLRGMLLLLLLLLLRLLLLQLLLTTNIIYLSRPIEGLLFSYCVCEIQILDCSLLSTAFSASCCNRHPCLQTN